MLFFSIYINQQFKSKQPGGNWSRLQFRILMLVSIVFLGRSGSPISLISGWLSMVKDSNVSNFLKSGGRSKREHCEKSSPRSTDSIPDRSAAFITFLSNQNPLRVCGWLHPLYSKSKEFKFCRTALKINEPVESILVTIAVLGGIGGAASESGAVPPPET